MGPTMDPEDERPDCCFDEWAAFNAKRARSKRIASPVTKALLGELEAVGIEGRSVLDVGCGTGDLALALLEQGASTAHGIDLGAGAVDNARSLAAERGFGERASFEVGDGSTRPLPPADVVVLNRVVCCFPDATALLANTLTSAQTVFAFSAPVDRGPMGLWNRFLLAGSNAWFSLRRAKYRGFRTFVHDLASIDAAIRAQGFTRRRHSRRRLVWELAVYSR